MRIGIPVEQRTTESRVAATPATVIELRKLGYEVAIEAGAGERASFPDSAYVAAGASIGSVEDVWSSEIVLKTDPPTLDELDRLRPGATIASTMAPQDNPDLLDQLANNGNTALALDAVPRISRAQSLDVLSSMANIAGYRAVVEAASAYGRMFAGQVTAAGKMPPAEVFVIGAGVAGLAAIGTASSMGAVVRAYDVRPEVAEQIESMGAEFVATSVTAQTEQASSDGYAREMSANLERAVLAMYAEQTQHADIVITTALVRGRPAPTLITAEVVAAMQPGSVIVDMAAAMGGNCELTVPDEKIVTDNGVTIIGYTDLAGRLPAQASQLFGTNLVNLLKLVTPRSDGQLVLDLDDEVQRAVTVTHEGGVLWPPPPVAVSAAPPPEPELAREAAQSSPKPKRSPMLRVFGVALAVVLTLLISVSAPGLLPTLTIFILAIVVGFYVISNVTHALHTPLMAETNAISGIILVGALLQIGSDSLPVTILAFVAVLVASINIFGGFLVSQRMLNMFRKG